MFLLKYYFEANKFHSRRPNGELIILLPLHHNNKIKYLVKWVVWISGYHGELLRWKNTKYSTPGAFQKCLLLSCSPPCTILELVTQSTGFLCHVQGGAHYEASFVGKLEYEKLPKTGIEILPSKPSNPGNGIFGGSPVVKPPFWTWLIVFAKIGASLSAAKGQRPKNYFSCCCDSYWIFRFA